MIPLAEWVNDNLDSSINDETIAWVRDNLPNWYGAAIGFPDPARGGRRLPHLAADPLGVRPSGHDLRLHRGGAAGELRAVTATGDRAGA